MVADDKQVDFLETVIIVVLVTACRQEIKSSIVQLSTCSEKPGTWSHRTNPSNHPLTLLPPALPNHFPTKNIAQTCNTGRRRVLIDKHVRKKRQ